jgi:uncharacterized membrane protein
VHAANPFTLPLATLIHLVLAIGALLLGPLALYSRKGQTTHRTAGYVWVLLMLGTATSSLFIRDFRLPNLAGYTPIHLLTLLTFVAVGGGLWWVVHGRISAHRRAMRGAYFGGCIGAGVFTLLPGRYLGDLLWHHALGLI